MNSKTVRVRVPASTANLGPGFDTLGMAFQFYTNLTMRVASTTEIRLIGNEVAELPTDKSNLLYKVAATLFEKAGKAVPELYIEVESEVPLTRGLGSSAAAIVGALAGANALADQPFTNDQLFAIASEMEGHPDNVGASMFGGIIVATMPDERGAAVPYVRLPVPGELQVLVVIPNYWLSTEKARTVLPDLYSKADVIYNVGHSSLLVAALAQGNLDLLAQAMRDRLHQPYRSQLVPGLAEMLTTAHEHGALGAALSGAGPTTLFFYSGAENEQKLRGFVDRVMTTHAITYQAIELKPDVEGVRVETVDVG